MRFDARDAAADMAGWARGAIAGAPGRARRHGPALAAAAALNALVIVGIAVSVHPHLLAPERAIVVFLARPFDRLKPAKPVRQTPPATTAPLRWRLPQPSAIPPPAVAPIAAAPPAPPAPPPSRWTVNPNGPRAIDDNPSVQRSLRGAAACAQGELWKLSAEAQANCLQRWGRFQPSEEDRFHRPPPRDPDGAFGRAAEAAEERRRPMRKAHIADCDLDAPGARMGVGCYGEDKAPK